MNDQSATAQERIQRTYLDNLADLQPSAWEQMRGELESDNPATRSLAAKFLIKCAETQVPKAPQPVNHQGTVSIKWADE